MLRFIFGKPKTGKTYRVLGKIKELSLQEKESVLIVPEQASFEAEKNILKELGDSSALYVECASFTRLYDIIGKKIGGVDGLVEKELIARLAAAEREIYTLTNELKNVVATTERTTDIFEKSVLYHDSVLRIMGDIRKYADSAECVVPAEIWPYPSYGELLFNI